MIDMLTIHKDECRKALRLLGEIEPAEKRLEGGGTRGERRKA